MIRYVQNQDIDYHKWDQCIASAFNGNIYAWSWYLDIVSEGWDALILDDYKQVMPVIAGKKYGIKYLYQPPFTQQLGIFTASVSETVTADDFLETLTHHYRFAEINLNHFNAVSHQSFRVQMRKNYELDLIKTYEQLIVEYTSNTNRNIRKAGKEGIMVVENIDPRSIITLFREGKGKELRRFGDVQYLKLEKLIYRALYKNMGHIFGAFDRNNQLCAGVFLLQSHHKLVFIFSATNSIARKNGAMHLIVDHIIRRFAGQHLTLDFEGSEIPGLARFYAGFGSAETHYPALYYNSLSFMLKAGLGVLRFLKIKQG